MASKACQDCYQKSALDNTDYQWRIEMAKIRMQRVENPDPKTMTIIECAVTPAIKGDGDTDYSCSGCSKTLLRKVGYRQLQKIVFKCPHCGAYSQIATVSDPN
jgi:DNA-directed RNA polymerase subunit RPC12/RpoP